MNTPATDINDIYDYETAIETAVKTLLTDNGITAVRQRDTAELATPRVDVQFAVGAGEDHSHVFRNGEQRPDIFNGNLRLQVVTSRNQNDTNHGTFRAKVREAIYKWRDSLNPILAYHAVLKVLESGTVPDIVEDQDQDVSIVNFNIVFCVRADAWPIGYLE